MLNKVYVLFFSLVAIMLATVLILRRNVNQLEVAMLGMAQKQRVMENYILSSFNESTHHDEAMILETCQPFLNDTSLVLYLPSSLCRACFSSLIFSLQDNSFPWGKVTVISEREDFEVRSECLSRDISFVIGNQHVELFSNIMLFRLYQGYLPISMEFSLNRESLLPLFLSDDERLLQVISGAD